MSKITQIPDRNGKVYEIKGRRFDNPFQLTMSLFESKWKMHVVKQLMDHDRLRYGVLKKTIPGAISHKMLIQSLRELERDGIVKRFVFSEVPPRVEYALTIEGLNLNHVIDEMSSFGNKYQLRTKK